VQPKFEETESKDEESV